MTTARVADVQAGQEGPGGKMPRSVPHEGSRQGPVAPKPQNFSQGEACSSGRSGKALPVTQRIRWRETRLGGHCTDMGLAPRQWR